MGSNLVRLTDKTYMTDLEERIRAVNEENLNKRISSRVVSTENSIYVSLLFSEEHSEVKKTAEMYYDISYAPR